MKDYLLIGGPCAGQVVKGADDAIELRVLIRRPYRLSGDKGPVETSDLAMEAALYRGERFLDKSGRSHIVMCADGIDPVLELLSGYMQAPSR